MTVTGKSTAARKKRRCCGDPDCSVVTCLLPFLTKSSHPASLLHRLCGKECPEHCMFRDHTALNVDFERLAKRSIARKFDRRATNERAARHDDRIHVPWNRTRFRTKTRINRHCVL